MVRRGGHSARFASIASNHTESARLDVVLFDGLPLVDLAQHVLFGLGQGAHVVAALGPGVERLVEHIRGDVA